MLITLLIYLTIGLAPSNADFPDSQDAMWLIEDLGFTQHQVEEYRQARRDFNHFLDIRDREWNRLATIQNDPSLPYLKNEAASRALLAMIYRDSSIQAEFRQKIDSFEQEIMARQQRLIDSGITPRFIFSDLSTSSTLVIPPKPIRKSDTVSAEEARIMETVHFWKRWGWLVTIIAILIAILITSLFFIFCLLIIAHMGKTSFGSKLISPRIVAISKQRSSLYLSAIGLAILWIVINSIYNSFNWSLLWHYPVFHFSHNLSQLENSEKALNSLEEHTILISSKFPNTKVWLGDRFLGTAPLGLTWRYLHWIGASDSEFPPVPALPINDIFTYLGQSYRISISIDNLDTNSFTFLTEASSETEIIVSMSNMTGSDFYRHRVEVIPGKPPSKPFHHFHEMFRNE